MIGKIVVIENEADLAIYGYENMDKEPKGKAQLAGGQSLSQEDRAELGEKAYLLKGCAACHKTDGTNDLAPAWNGLFGKQEEVLENGKRIKVVVDEAYIIESIKDPMQKITVGYENTPMPVFPMTDDDIENIIAYIKKIK